MFIREVDRTMEEKELERRRLQDEHELSPVVGHVVEDIHYISPNNGIYDVIDEDIFINLDSVREWEFIRDHETGIPYACINGYLVLQNGHRRVPAFSIYKNPDWWDTNSPMFIPPSECVSPTVESWIARSADRTWCDPITGIECYVNTCGRWIIDSYHCRVPVNKFYRISDPKNWERNHPYFVSPGLDVSDDTSSFRNRSSEMKKYDEETGKYFYVDRFDKWIVDKYHRRIPVPEPIVYSGSQESHPFWYDPTRNDVIVPANYNPLKTFHLTYFEEDIDGIEYRKLEGKWILNKDHHREARDLDPTTPPIDALTYARTFKSGTKKGQLRRKDNPRRTGIVESINPVTDEKKQAKLIEKMKKSSDPFEQDVLFAELVLGKNKANARRYAMSVVHNETYYEVWRHGDSADIQKSLDSTKASGSDSQLSYAHSVKRTPEESLTSDTSLRYMYQMAKEKYGELGEVILIFYALKADITKYFDFQDEKVDLVENIFKEIEGESESAFSSKSNCPWNYLFEKKLSEYGYDVADIKKIRQYLKDSFQREFR